MRLWFRFRNDPRRFKPLVISGMGLTYRYWVVTTTTFDDVPLIKVVGTFEDALAIANAWADEYRAAWVAANMKAA